MALSNRCTNHLCDCCHLTDVIPHFNSLLNSHSALLLYLDQVDGSLTETNVQPLRWRHNGRDSVSNHQPHCCSLNRVFIRRSKKTSKLRVTGLYAGNSPGPGEFPVQMASNAENVSIWWRHHDTEMPSVAESFPVKNMVPFIQHRWLPWMLMSWRHKELVHLQPLY